MSEGGRKGTRTRKAGAGKIRGSAERLPLYLVAPETDAAHWYGRVWYEERLNNYVIEAEPAVLELAKRVFPGCRGRDLISFKATRRAAGDLNWLLLRFPLRLECDERFERDRVEAIAHAARRQENQTLAPIARPAGFVGTLHPFQAEGVPFLVANQRALLADDMGLGKTVQALAALGEVGTWPAVIVAPPNVLFQWERMIGAFLDGGPRVHRVRGLTAYDLPEAEIYLIHYGLLRGWGEVLRATGLKTVIFDEVQELRHTGTQKYSEASLLAGEARNCWGLSGTPIYNYGGEIWAVMNILEYHCLGDFDSFTREWGTGYQSLTVAKPEVLGDYLRREGLMLRRRKSEVMDQLPPKRRSVIPIDHDQNEYVKLAGRAIEQARSYSSITDWHEKGLVKRQIEGAARQATGVAKAQWASQFIGSLILAGERPLIFAHHHAVHDILHRWLNSVSQVSIATGKQTQDQKDAAIRAFAEGHVKGIQLGLRTTAGLDGLQGMGTCVVFCELDWSPAVHAQCEDRLQRMGVDCARESIMCYYLVAATGSDETMQGALGLKIGQFVGIMGDKGEGAEDKALAAAATERHLGTLIERLAGENRTDQCEMKETHRK